MFKIKCFCSLSSVENISLQHTGMAFNLLETKRGAQEPLKCLQQPCPRRTDSVLKKFILLGLFLPMTFQMQDLTALIHFQSHWCETWRKALLKVGPIERHCYHDNIIPDTSHNLPFENTKCHACTSVYRSKTKYVQHMYRYLSLFIRTIMKLWQCKTQYYINPYFQWQWVLSMILKKEVNNNIKSELDSHMNGCITTS